MFIDTGFSLRNRPRLRSLLTCLFVKDRDTTDPVPNLLGTPRPSRPSLIADIRQAGHGVLF